MATLIELVWLYRSLPWALYSQLFEVCLIVLYGDYLASSDYQFVFQKNIGCDNSIYALATYSLLMMHRVHAVKSLMQS